MDRIFQLESQDFQNVSQQILTNLYYSGPISPLSHLEADIIELAKQDLISIFYDCNFDLQKITNIFHSKEWDQEKIKYFHELMERTKSEFCYAAFNHFNSSYCETIVNFDWLVKFVLGTSELKTIKYPLLQLMMFTLNKNGSQNKIMYDANKDTLLKIIHTLENIQ